MGKESPLLMHPKEMVSCFFGRSRLFPRLPHATNPSLLSGIWPLKPKPQLPAPTHHSRWADKHLRLVSAGQHQSSVRESLCFALCTLLLHSPLWLWSFPPAPLTPCPHQLRGFLAFGNFSSFTAPSQRCRSHPYSFVSVFSFFFCPTQVHGDFLAFWEVWGFLLVFSRYFVGVVSHVDVFLMYLLGGRWSPYLTSPPSWRSTCCSFCYHYYCWRGFNSVQDSKRDS